MSLSLFQNNVNNQIMRLLNIVDPFNNKQITFSDCVNLFQQVR